MIGPIARLWRQLSAVQTPMVTTVILVIGIHGTSDPTRRGTGYGGVLPVPSGPTAAAATRVDPLLGQRKDTRAERGRVLYSAGHAPKATATAPSHTTRKVPCPDRRVSQGRGATTTPNS